MMALIWIFKELHSLGNSVKLTAGSSNELPSLHPETPHPKSLRVAGLPLISPKSFCIKPALEGLLQSACSRLSACQHSQGEQGH